MLTTDQFKTKAEEIRQRYAHGGFSLNHAFNELGMAADEVLPFEDQLWYDEEAAEAVFWGYTALWMQAYQKDAVPAEHVYDAMRGLGRKYIADADRHKAIMDRHCEFAPDRDDDESWRMLL